MNIAFADIDNESIVIVLKDVYIFHWDETHFDSYYNMEIQEYDYEKRIFKQTYLEKMCWENWLLSAELFRAWKDKKSQELNIHTRSCDNNFGLSIIADQTVPKLIFEIGTRANYFRPIPYGTAFLQDIYWEELLRISLEVFKLELIGLKKCCLKKIEDDEAKRLLNENRLKILESKIEFCSKIEPKNFTHPGDIVNEIKQELEKNKCQ